MPARNHARTQNAVGILWRDESSWFGWKRIYRVPAQADAPCSPGRNFGWLDSVPDSPRRLAGMDGNLPRPEHVGAMLPSRPGRCLARSARAVGLGCGSAEVADGTVERFRGGAAGVAAHLGTEAGQSMGAILESIPCTSPAAACDGLDLEGDPPSRLQWAIFGDRARSSPGDLLERSGPL